MARSFTGGKLVIATHNPGKLREIGELLVPFGAEVVSAGDLGLPEPVEDGADFLENALIKSRAAALASGLPALADDSGLVVDALGGEPGIHSARWGGPQKDFGLAMRRVLSELGNTADRSAHFACALSLCWPDGHHEDFLGKVHGHIATAMRGARGFGYDPIFIADGHLITFGEMAPEEKHRISHRADAFRQLVAACFQA